LPIRTVFANSAPILPIGCHKVAGLHPKILIFNDLAYFAKIVFV